LCLYRKESTKRKNLAETNTKETTRILVSKKEVLESGTSPFEPFSTRQRRDRSAVHGQMKEFWRERKAFRGRKYKRGGEGKQGGSTLIKRYHI